MKHVERSALLPYSAEQMFDVVNDVTAYPEFLPWCDRTEILEATNTMLIARLWLSKGGVQQAFSTRNQLQRPAQMHLELEEGPFRLLEGDWQFTALGDAGCRVEMNLRFEMDSKLAGMVLGKVFEKAADTLVQAFCERADDLYG